MIQFYTNDPVMSKRNSLTTSITIQINATGRYFPGGLEKSTSGILECRTSVQERE